MAWMEECHTKLSRFDPLQLVQLMQVRLGVCLGQPLAGVGG